MESAGDPAEDSPPPPPEGVHANVTERPTFSKIMAALVDQVKKSVEQAQPDNKFEAYISGIEVEQDKVTALQKELLQKLADLEKLESSKITSDNIRIGFDSSHVRSLHALKVLRSRLILLDRLLTRKRHPPPKRVQETKQAQNP